MKQLPECPICKSSYTYEEGEFYICPECEYKWKKEDKEN